jgi:hypothetical protein
VPRLQFSRAFTANQTIEIVGDQNWQYQYVPWAAKLIICVRATTNGLVMTVNAGALTLVQQSFVPGGGTIGTTPTAFNSPVIEEMVAAGDRLSVSFRETLGGTPTLDGWLDLVPLG